MILVYPIAFLINQLTLAPQTRAKCIRGSNFFTMNFSRGSLGANGFFVDDGWGRFPVTEEIEHLVNDMWFIIQKHKWVIFSHYISQ